MNLIRITVSAALLGIGLLSLATAHPQDQILERGAGRAPIRVAGIYDPKYAVRLVGEHTVPEGKMLVVTALGTPDGGLASLSIMDFWPDGAPEIIRITTLPTDPIVEFPPPGIVIHAGRRLIGGVVFGYMIDAPDTRGKVRSTDDPSRDVRIVGIPGDPRDFVYFRETAQGPGFGFQVPVGKRLIVTAVGSAYDPTEAFLYENGNRVQRVELGLGRMFYAFPQPGMIIEGGRLAQVYATAPVYPAGRAIGYLVDL